MSEEAIQRLRTRFEEELKANGNDYHAVDIERVRTETWQVKRFILDQTTIAPAGTAESTIEDNAFNALTTALKWKKTFGVHERNDQYFPKELWELMNAEDFGTDKATGKSPVQWELIRNQRTFKEANLLSKQFVAHILERLDRKAGEHGFIMVSDANGAGVSNVDMELAKFKIFVIEMYPLGLKANYIVDLPWLLNAIMKIVLGFMNERLKKATQFVKSSELKNVMDEKYIPKELGGQRTEHDFPGGTTHLDQTTHLGFDDKFFDNFYKTYKLKRTNK